ELRPLRGPGDVARLERSEPSREIALVFSPVTPERPRPGGRGAADLAAQRRRDAELLSEPDGACPHFLEALQRERVRRPSLSEGIPSPVEAAMRLIESAAEMTDSGATPRSARR